MKAVNFGIDLGTTNSLIAKYDANTGGLVTIFKNPIGHKESLASVVAFRKDRVLVGDKAREYLQKDPVNVFGGFKRRMGTDDKSYVVNIDENITPIELSTYILRELQQFVHTGEKVEAAVITIPASFDTMQSNATKEAGLKAGLQEVYLLQEPIAASLAYFNHKKEESTNGYWLVYDLGGGTFDIALIEIRDGEMKVKDHEGNNFLGGVDFDRLIVENIILPKIISETGISNFEDLLFEPHGPFEKLLYLLLYKAEEAKKELSSHNEADIDFSLEVDGKEYDLYITITVDQFNSLIEKHINDTIKMLQNIMTRNNLQSSSIKEIVMVGGSTFIPYVREQLQKQTSVNINTSIDPTSVVAIGAAYYAANKYYQPKEEDIIPVEIDDILEKVAQEDYQNRQESVSVDLVYSKMSKEDEEVLLIRLDGDYDELNLNYRIIRSDGGFDTGFVKTKPKYTEFLPLLSGITNNFTLKFYDINGEEVKSLSRDIAISQGQFSISGQPLPKDICIEVDDRDNNTTRLEVIFSKNSILPLKKTLYREISKTIKRGSADSIIINILEGDQFTRALSNLTIGCIEISGKDLTSDLLKGSDIEIQISISDNRELKTEVFLVMTKQEFKNVFSISKKSINIQRLREQYYNLEDEIRNSLKDFNKQNESIWTIQTDNLLNELISYKSDLMKLKLNDKSDKKYIIAEAISRISQEYDKIGGNDRLESLQSDYLTMKENTKASIDNASFDKESLLSRFNKIIQSESNFLRSRNPSVINRVIESLDDLSRDASLCTNSTIIHYYLYFRNLDIKSYTNASAAKNIIQMADRAMDNQKYIELRQHTINLANLLPYEQQYIPNTEFKGTGIS
ncbi:MAG: Hsp70 family protein [Dysgonomonas sp.]|nr:Hsp70 family protein [Dysgonomonas sp.]